MTKPASAVWTLRRILIAPVRLLTATRKAWTLNATERGVPSDLPAARRLRPFAPAAVARSARLICLPGRETAASTRDHAVVGIRLQDLDGFDRRAEHGGGDLAMHRARAVAELRGADRDLIGSVVAQRRAGVGDVAERRHGIDHAKRDALSGQPIVGRRRRQAAAVVHRAPGQGEALIEAVAAILNIMAFLRPGRDHRIAGAHDIALAKRDRVHADRARQFVHRRLDGEVGLRQAVAAEGATRHRVGVHREGVDLLVVAAINRKTFRACVIDDGEAVVTVGAGIGDDVHLHGRQVAVAPRAGLDAHPHRVPRRRTDELLLAGELELDRLAGL